MAKLFIEDLDLPGKRVLMRVDFNVPTNNGRVENDKRLSASLPSIQYVLGRGASLAWISIPADFPNTAAIFDSIA
jgi:phosphoglycerate kinase